MSRVRVVPTAPPSGASAHRQAASLGAALAVLLLAGVIALVAACKQGENDRCQVTDDCEEPLVCAQATQTCETSTGTTPIDARAPDGDIVDATPDAPRPDAPPDAPPDAT